MYELPSDLWSSRQYQKIQTWYYDRNLRLPDLHWAAKTVQLIVRLVDVDFHWKMQNNTGCASAGEGAAGTGDCGPGSGDLAPDSPSNTSELEDVESHDTLSCCTTCRPIFSVSANDKLECETPAFAGLADQPSSP